jgi:hypothetical protein
MLLLVMIDHGKKKVMIKSIKFFNYMGQTSYSLHLKTSMGSSDMFYLPYCHRHKSTYWTQCILKKVK